MKVELKGIKEAGGEETPRFEALVYIDGKKAAIVSNGGTGGCNHYHWFDVRLVGQFLAYAKEQFPDLRFEAEDAVIYRLLDAAANAKKLKRLCAAKTLAHLPGQTYKEGEWSVFKVKFTPEVKTQLEAKYPGVRFANEGL